MFDDLHDPEPPQLGPQRLATIATRAERLRRQRPLRWTVAVSAVLITGSVTALVLRSPDDRAPASPPPMTAPEPSSATAAPASSTVAASSPPVASGASPGESVPFVSEAARTELQQLSDSTRELARDVSSYRAHVVRTFHDSGADPIEFELDVVLDSSGAAWSTRADGGWSSYDPSTATTRSASGGPDFLYQEIVGVDFGSGHSQPIGFAPVAQFFGGESATITADTMPELDDRSVWRVDVHAEEVGVSDSSSFTSVSDVVYLIDQATGLTLAYESTESIQEADGSTSTRQRSSRFTEFEIGVPLPAEFPGSFPEGAAVEQGRTPNLYANGMSEDELATAFGPGLLVPDMEADPPIVLLSSSAVPPTGSLPVEPGSINSVSFTWLRGFDRIQGWVAETSPDQPLGEEFLGVVSGGALDGLPIYRPEPNGPYAVDVTIDGQSVWVQIDARSVDEAAELLATFRQPVR